jgi:hypothetical protein
MRVLLLLLAGCGTASAPDASAPDLATEPPDLELCDPSEVGDAGETPSFTNVQRVFDFTCIGCHCCGDPLTLSAAVSYGNLINKPPGNSDIRVNESCGGVLVKPGDPSSSYLYQKISNTHPCAGNPMPLNEFGFEPLPACAQDLVRRWILAGAPNN